MTRHKMILSAALLTLIYSAASSAQNPANYAPVPDQSSQASAQKAPVALTWNYYRSQRHWSCTSPTIQAGTSTHSALRAKRRTQMDGATTYVRSSTY